MIRHLKEKQHYIDLYDRSTVNDCRWRENFHRTSKPSKDLPPKVSEEFHRSVSEIALHYDLLYATLRSHEEKERTINEWMERDREKDSLYERATAPEGIRCLTCRILLSPNDKILYDGHDGKSDRVLFIYDCPNGCVMRRTFFHDGEEFVIKRTHCSKCDGEMSRTSERVGENKVVTTETCNACGHIDVDEFDLTPKKEKPDPEYAKDRARFCLSGEFLTKSIEEKRYLEGISRFVDKWKEKEEHKEEYDAVANIQKLTVLALENFLAPLCEEKGFVRFQFGTPDMGKDVVVAFTAHDANPDRTDRASSYEIQRTIKKALEDTNWRLMSDGVSYRMGVVSGRLRAYEREEDLLELVKKILSTKYLVSSQI